ncbi:T-cell surface antigen CD2 [Rhynchocyon petersi]
MAYASTTAQDIKSSQVHAARNPDPSPPKTWIAYPPFVVPCPASAPLWAPPHHPTSLTEKGLSVYLILSIVGGGIALFIFVALLLLFYISKKRKRGSMRNDEEPEIRTHKITPEERVRKPNQTPGFICQTPAVSQPPPPPGHRCRPVGHRVQQQQQKRPIPTPSGTQVQQQKGPPLPRPRVQQKLLPSAVENS